MMSTAGVAGKEVAHRGSEEPEDRGNGPQTLCRHLSLPSSSRSARTLGTRTPLRLDERTSSATPGIPPLPATPTLLRTSSDSLLFKSSPGSEAALGGILDTIAEQGSTAWMALPDDILQTCELQLGSDALAEDHAEAAGASQPSKPRQRRPKPPLILTGNPLFRPTAADMGWSSNDFQAAELPVRIAWWATGWCCHIFRD